MTTSVIEQSEEIVTPDVSETLDEATGATPDASSPDVAETDEPDTPSLAEPVEMGEDGQPVPPPVVVPRKPTPYLAKVLGQQYEAEALGLTGAQVRSDGTVEVPPAAAARLSQLISKGRMYEERVPQQLHEAREEARQARTAFNEDAARGAEVFQMFAQLGGMSEQDIYDWAMDFKGNQPLLQARIELAMSKQQHAQRTQPDAGAYNLPPDVIEAQAQDAAMQRTMAIRTKIKGLTEDQSLEVANKLWRNRGLYVGIADRDYPEAGVVRGQPVFNAGKWDEDFEDRAGDMVRGAQQLAHAAKVKPKVASAAAGNAAVLNGNGAKGPPPPPGGAASTTKKSTDEETEPQYHARMRRQYGATQRSA